MASPRLPEAIIMKSVSGSAPNNVDRASHVETKRSRHPVVASFFGATLSRGLFSCRCHDFPKSVENATD